MSDNKTTRRDMLELPALGVCIASGQMDPDSLDELREQYGDGLAVVDGMKAWHDEPARLLVVEQRTWAQLPAAIKSKLRAAYKYGDGLRVLPDDFLEIVNASVYPTSQWGNSLLFCVLYGGKYVHTAKPAAGYFWEMLESDGGISGGYWKRDENDTRLRAELDKWTGSLWSLVLTLRPLDDADSGGKGQGRDKKGNAAQQADNQPEDPEEEARKARADRLKHWRSIVRERYDALANFERNQIMDRIKGDKDKEGVIINDPARCSHLLPCLNGTYDLRTHTFRSSSPSDYAAYYVPTVYDKAAEDADAARALDLFFDHKKELARYFWQLVGTALNPEKRKDTKAMVQLIGTTTNNGKTTTTNALMAMLGDSSGTGLAQTVRAEAFAKNGSANGQTLTPDYALIGHARLVFISEPSADLRLNWAEIKKLTGGGKMNVNPKNEKAYSIKAQFSMFWDQNVFLRCDDQTVFDRGTMRLIPCEHRFLEDERDPDIDEKLAKPAARSYLLRLALEGLEDYEKNGFAVPEECRTMLFNYEKSSDKIGEFLDACFTKTDRPADKLPIAKVVYPAYVKWLEDNGYKGVESRPEFSRKLGNRPGVTIGSRHNAQTLDGYTTKEQALVRETSGAPAIPFGGADPLAWYLERYTVEGTAEADPEQMEVGKDPAATPQTVPALTLGNLAEDFKQRAKKEDPAAKLPDACGILAELLRRGWRLALNQDVSRTEIGDHRILTEEELTRKGQQQVQAIAQDIQKQVSEALDKIEDQRTRQAVRYLTGEGTLPRLTKQWPESVRRVILLAMLEGDPIPAAAVKIAQQLHDKQASSLARQEQRRQDAEWEKKWQVEAKERRAQAEEKTKQRLAEYAAAHPEEVAAYAAAHPETAETKEVKNIS